MNRQRLTVYLTTCPLLAMIVNCTGIKSAAGATKPTATQAASKMPVNPAATSNALPLRDVVLFSSGVGYFGREGRINGRASLDLSFRAEQINDVLKSLVLQDSAGKVQPVTYTTQESVARRLQSAGISLDRGATLGQLLRQFQGAQIRLQTRKGIIEGLLVSVSTRNLPVTKREESADSVARPPIWFPPEWPANVEVANVMTYAGLRAVSLDDVIHVRIMDAHLDRELRESLKLLAKSADEKQRSVRLNFGAGASRVVRAGYLLETPIWKTSYRLVLGDGKSAKPYLQGWAIVENMTDENWYNVRLSLVSGRPISFIQNLYQPLYVPRPVVAPQIVGSPRPQTYGAAIEDFARELEVADEAGEKRLRALAPAGAAGPRGGAAKRDMGGGGFGGGGLGVMADSINGAMAMSSEGLQQSVVSQAQGAERGELFEYAIGQYVTLPKQQAALVPIVSENIDGEKVSIFDANAAANQALNGFQMRNSTGLHLSGGPLTVFDDGIYAGDAQINNVAPGEKRLLSYAVDLGLEVKRDGASFRRETVSIVVRNGVLVINHRQFRDQVYTFRNKTDKDKTVLVQQNIEAGFELVEPKQPEEKTANEYRFKVAVPAGKTVNLKVITQQPVSQTLGVFDMDLNMLIEYSRGGQVKPELRQALEEVVKRRQRIAELQASLAQMDRKIAEIDQDQNRIRNNMNGLNRDSELYKRYVAKLNDQETELEKLREQRALTRDAEFEAQRELREYVSKLTIE